MTPAVRVEITEVTALNKVAKKFVEVAFVFVKLEIFPLVTVALEIVEFTKEIPEIFKLEMFAFVILAVVIVELETVEVEMVVVPTSAVVPLLVKLFSVVDDSVDEPTTERLVIKLVEAKEVEALVVEAKSIVN
jgi:hypothetical protein